MHNEEVPHKTSAHFRFRNGSTAAPLFDGAVGIDADFSDTAASTDPQAPKISALQIQIIPPSIEKFISAHHKRGAEHTMNEAEAKRAISASDRILRLLSDGEWHDRPSVEHAARVASATERLRDLRKLSVTLDGNIWHLHVVRRRTAPGSSVWEYRAELQLTPQPPPTKQR